MPFLRLITNFFALVGFVLAGSLVYLGYYPLINEPKNDPDIAKLINCGSYVENFNDNLIEENKIDALKAKLGDKAPIELVKRFTKAAADYSSQIGATVELNLQTCEDPRPKEQLIGLIREALADESNSQNKFYDSGSAGELVDFFNKLPLVNLPVLNTSQPSTFARSNYCNASIINSRAYFFTVVPGASDSRSRIIHFKIKLNSKTDIEPRLKFAQNLIKSGQYLKSKIYCNE